MGINLRAGSQHPAADTEMMRACEQVLVDTFRIWGFREADTPIIDSARILETETAQAAYRLMDPRGQILALRPDWTTPIAYLAAMHPQPELLPLKLFYRGSVFRTENMEPKELHQTGVEVLGAPGDLADGEVVSLAAQSLSAVGLEDFRIGIGHVRFVAGLMEHWNIGGPEQSTLQEALSRRDFVAFRSQVAELNLSSSRRAFLQRLPELSGDQEVLEQGREADPGVDATRALDTLGHVVRDLKSAGLNRHIYIDLGMIRDQEYYTGIVFEGYTQGLGHPLLGGGRYDQLAHRFGADLPATGFAVHMERLLQVLSRPPQLLAGPEILVVPASGHEAEAVLEADRLRQSGRRALLEITGRTEKEACVYAQRQGCHSVRIWQQGKWNQVNFHQGGMNND